MIHNILFIFPILFFIIIQDAHAEGLESYLKKRTLPQNFIKKISSGAVISLVDIHTFEIDNKKRQKMHFNIIAQHPRSCTKAARKMGQYEEYAQYLSFVKESRYGTPPGMIYLSLKAPILPQVFILNFKIARIQGPGEYPFSFHRGFLKGLQGKIAVVSLPSQKCIIHLFGHWQGPHSGFNDFLFEMFSQTLLKIGLNKLIRMSSI